VDAHEQVARMFLANHPEAAARELERADPVPAAETLAALTPSVAADVYRAMGPSHAAACAGALDDASLAAMVAWMPLDAGGAILRRLDEERRRRVLERVDEELRSRLGAKLLFPADTAGALADPTVPALPEDLTIVEAMRQLRSMKGRAHHEIYVVGRDRVLVGATSLADLIAAPPAETLASVARRDLVRLDASLETSAVGAHPAWADWDELPVVDPGGRLVGVVRHRMIRRASAPLQRPLVATLVSLSEVYWAGLSGILAGLSPTRLESSEADHAY
jgi:magnesium transporter